MALFNEILEGRYNRALQKILSMKGRPVTPQLAGEIIPVLPLFWGREFRYLEEWRIFGSRGGTAAVAAQDSCGRINNPAGSNTIAIIEGLKFWCGVANSESVIEYSNTASGNLGNVFTGAGLDNRFQPSGSGTGGSALQLSTGNNVAQGTHTIFDDLALATAGNISPEIIAHEDLEIPLLPNSDLQIRTITVNTTFSMSVRWRERVLAEGERF